MRILSIETSCDETGITIMEAKGGLNNASFRVLADNVASQIETHIPFGGVYPALAKREHLKNLPIILGKILAEFGENPGIGLIAVTYGPGLEPALWTGIVFAQELAKKWNIPVIPVNHMEGHLLSVFGKKKGIFQIEKIKQPALSLLVSGGHTELVLMKKFLDYKIIGETLDDAVGEAFDKVARMLGLPYPGGPQISKLAAELRSASPKPGLGLKKDNKNKNMMGPKPGLGRIKATFHLPRPMLNSGNFDFSYSGLKTAVLYLIRDLGGLEKLTAEQKAEIALEFENAAIEVLVKKTAKAIEKYKIKTLMVGGGVSANDHLRKELKKLARDKKLKLLSPTKELSTDNSIMIGIAGYLNYIGKKRKTRNPKSIKAVGNLRL